MGKGKKKAKGKKMSGGKKVTEDNSANDSPRRFQPSQEQVQMAIMATANRTEDPLKNWTRIQNEECPICMLPLPHQVKELTYWNCCGKMICSSCQFSVGEAHVMSVGDQDDMEKIYKEAVEKAKTCPFCRTEHSGSHTHLEKVMERANAGQHEAMCRVGECYFQGEMGLRQDKAEGSKWFHRALEAGSGKAGYILGAYYSDDGVEQDIEKSLEYYQKSVDLGFSPSFMLMGHVLKNKGDIEEAMLNYRKAAMCGMSDKYIFDQLRTGFKCGFITKDEYAFTLREHQKACNEMKSDGREQWNRSDASHFHLF